MTDKNKLKRISKVLQGIGWDFFPTAPEEWSWMLFDPESGRCIGQQGDMVWKHDLEIAKKICGVYDEEIK